MLARLETLYLGILRVVILVIATLALIAAVVGFVGAVPSLLRQLDLVAEPEPAGGTLGEYVAEKKLTAASTEKDVQDAPTDDAVDPDLAAAAKALRRYTLDMKGPEEATWRAELVKSVDRVSPGQGDAYLKSVRSLADQLVASKGKKLTLDQVAELMGWHEQRFVEAAGRIEGERAADATGSSLTLYAAGSAFVLFILITFTFLFVKIERSLRVVRTRPAVEDPHA